MSSAAPPLRDEPVQRTDDRPLERLRGRWGMWLLVATEAMLFVFFFFAYFYLGAHRPEWPPGSDPSLRYALPMLGILLLSSAVLWWGEKGIEDGAVGRLKASLAGTLFLGLGFLALSWQEYRVHLRTETPDMNAYASIFYSITSLHLAHLTMGMLMLGWILARAVAGHFSEERHVAVKNVSLYWHFVDTVWLLVVAVLYLSPRLYA